MKLVKCKSCGNDVSKGAKACPSCGRDQRNFFMKHKIISVLGIIVILAILGSMGSKKDEPVKTTAQTDKKVE